MLNTGDMLVVGGGVWTIFGGYVLKKVVDIIECWLSSKMGSEAADDIMRVGKSVVVSTWQEYVKGIKAGREDGKLTAEEKAMAAEMAKEMFLKTIKSGSLEFLKDNVQNIDEYIKGIIEQEIYATKKAAK